jgi:hypothetical protein
MLFGDNKALGERRPFARGNRSKLVRLAAGWLAAVLLLAACAGPGSASSASVGNAAVRPRPAAVVEAGLLTINGTSVMVPAAAPGLGTPAQGRIPPHITFLKKGPIENTIGGSFTVAVLTDSSANAALGRLTAATGPVTAAVFGYTGKEMRVLAAGPHTVLKVVKTEVISGAGLGYPDRVYNDYLFAGSDGKSIVSATTDVLSEADVVAYIGAIKV